MDLCPAPLTYFKRPNLTTFETSSWSSSGRVRGPSEAPCTLVFCQYSPCWEELPEGLPEELTAFPEDLHELVRFAVAFGQSTYVSLPMYWQCQRGLYDCECAASTRASVKESFHYAGLGP